MITTRDLSGRVATVTDGSGTRTFSYTPAGLPLSETFATGRSLTWDYDTAGRKVGYALWENGAFQTWGGWGYSPANGKMNGVATREGWMTDTDAAMAKLFASEALARITDNALQIFGGMGLMEELPIERFWRDARVERIWDGTSEIQRHIISRALLRPFER